LAFEESPENPLNNIDAWSEVGGLFIDEFSMVTSNMMGLIDTYPLRQLKGEPNKLYGGVHLIFCGDFYQLPAVDSGTIYSNINATAGVNTIRVSNGRHTWKKCLTDAIELTKSTGNKTRNGHQPSKIFGSINLVKMTSI
jgi:hypothetical protein